MEFTAQMLAQFLGGEVAGDDNAAVSTFAKIEEGHAGALSFLSNPKYENYIYNTASSIVIVNRTFVPSKPVKATMVRVDDAYSSFAKLLELYASMKPKRTGVSPKAVIDESVVLSEDSYVGHFAVIEAGAKIGAGAQIYHHVVIGENVTLGDNVKLYPNVTIYEGCVLGNNVTIHSGTIIGADGFGFAHQADGTYEKIPQIGNVVIEDNVEIGANTCIDRATMGSTIIHKGVKLDNLIQIGHNATIGENTVMAAMNGVAGSAKVGRNVMTGGQVGIVGHITVGDNVKVGSKTGVTSSVGDNETVFGYPVMPASKHHRSFAIFRNLPELDKKVSSLEKAIKELQEK